MTKQEIYNIIKSNKKIEFEICNEWRVSVNNEKISIQHTYHFKGENFDNIKNGLKYLNTKLNYMLKVGYDLQVQYI